MACTKETVKSNGLNVWSDESTPGSAPEVDIVAIQGLGADPFYTWVKRCPAPDIVASKRCRARALFRRGKKTQGIGGKDRSTDVMWPRDLLVPLLKNARIATYSYKSDWRDRNVKTGLRQCAEQLLNVLFQHRQCSTEYQRPLVLIGHSLGGLVIQQALVMACLDPDFANIRLSTVGIIFLGAPFQGSDAAVYGEWLAQLTLLDSTLLKSLKKDSPSLHALSRDFWNSHSEWDIVCFYENRETSYGPLETLVVSLQSASLLGKRMIFLNTNHSGLNKYSGFEDENFVLLLPEILRMVEDGRSVVIDRFRRKDTATIGHAKPAGNMHWMVPRAVNGLFTGRAELLRQVQDAFHGDRISGAEEQNRFVITGLGGQGKSEVCLKVASLMREDFWGVFWVDVGSPSIAESDFIAVAKILGTSAECIGDSLRVIANTKESWLLILDNADNPDFDYHAYLPSGTQGAVILTSRVSDCSRYSTVGFAELTSLDTRDSTQLLLKAAEIPKESWRDYNQQAKEVVELLGSHTLALIQAGAYIARGHCRLDQYPKDFLRQRKRLLEYRPRQAQSRYRHVYATFEASAHVLEHSASETGKDALQLLVILSMIHFSVLPLQIFEDAWGGSEQIFHTDSTETNGLFTLSLSHVSQLPDFMIVEGSKWDDYRLVEASSLLVSLSLITRNSSTGLDGLSMHPLTHAWAKDRQELEQQRQAWTATGSVLALSCFNSDQWQEYERYLRPHVHSYLGINVKTVFSFGKVTVSPILLECGSILLQMRDDSRLGCLLEDVFAELKIDPAIPSKEYLQIYDLKAVSLMDLGEHTKAVELLEQIVMIKEAILAENHPDRLASQHELARAYKANGQVKQAVELLEQVVKIQETTLAEDHPDRLASQQALANIYKKNQ